MAQPELSARLSVLLEQLAASQDSLDAAAAVAVDAGRIRLEATAWSASEHNDAEQAALRRWVLDSARVHAWRCIVSCLQECAGGDAFL